MYTSPLITGVPEAIITLKNGWSIHATAENLAYVYKEEHSPAIGIKVNHLVLKPEDVDTLYYSGVRAHLQLDPAAPGGMKWI